MVKIERDVSLKSYNTFGIEAKCSYFAKFSSVDDLRKIFSNKEVEKIPWFVLGGGSNIVFSKDYDGLVLHPIDDTIEITEESSTTVKVRAGAGVVWDDFVSWCVERELWGVENLSHIPGSLGAAPVQNVGAYGVEVKDVLESVNAFAVDSLSTITVANEHCDFSYRQSIFKHTLRGKVIITSVNFILQKEGTPNVGYGDLNNKVKELGGPTIGNIRKAVMEIRGSKLPDPKEIGNAGSFFKNPFVDDSFATELRKEFPSMPLYPSSVEGKSKLAAGWLIDQCGWKGFREGNVGVHKHQALVLVNYGGATGGEVFSLAGRIREDVKERFGIELEFEVNVL